MQNTTTPKCVESEQKHRHHIARSTTNLQQQPLQQRQRQRQVSDNSFWNNIETEQPHVTITNTIFFASSLAKMCTIHLVNAVPFYLSHFWLFRRSRAKENPIVSLHRLRVTNLLLLFRIMRFLINLFIGVFSPFNSLIPDISLLHLLLLFLFCSCCTFMCFGFLSKNLYLLCAML